MRSKAILMALLAFVFGSVEAVPVTRLQATYAARAWVKQGVRLGARIGATVEKTDELTAANGARYYAVKMRDGGTVLMSGDTEYEPVLAFTPDAFDFSTIEKGSPLEALLNADLALRRRAAEVRAKTAAPVQPVRSRQLSYAAAPAGSSETVASRRWAKLMPTFASAPAKGGVDMAAPIPQDANVLDDMRVDIMLKTWWNQSTSANGVDPCFNYYTPNNYVCGCVATATAQLMRYHCWPTNDVEKFKNECTVDNQPRELETLGGPYDWANMPEVVVETDEEAQALGRLSYECGVAVQMAYAADGSGAVTADVPPALKRIFGYANALWFGDQKKLTTDEATREKVIYPSLDAGYPVLFSIRGNLGGHAVVCDGYGYNDVGGEKTPYVHINMGWAGQNNWWYNIPDIDVGANPESFTGFDILNGVAYDVFPTETGRILSGRVLDDDGQPVVGARVMVGDTTVVSTNHGVYAFILQGVSGRVDVYAESEDGRFMGEVECDFSSGDSWGNDVTISRPAVAVNGKEFSTLDRALAFAATNDNSTLRILIDVDLRRPFTITNACTITATNPVPRASMILPSSGAKLTLAKGADVTFTNVAFQHDDRLMVEAQTGSVVRVSGIADLGEIRLAEVSNLRLAGPLQSGIIIDAPFAKGNGETFGRFASYTEEAAATANCLLNKYDEESGGESYWDAGEDRYQLRWKSGAEVPESAATVRYEGEGETIFYRSLAVLFKYHPSGGDAVLLKNAVFTNDVTLSSPFNLSGAMETPVVVKPTETARLTVEEGGSLVLTNVTFRGYRGLGGLFIVNGGDMTLESGATLEDLQSAGNKNQYLGGAVSVFGGSLTMKSGSAISKCSTDIGYGGGVLLMGGDASTLNLLGGEIVDCNAAVGGGVYADSDTIVNIEGDVVVRGNVSDNDAIDDLNLFDSTCVFTLTGPLTSVGSAVGVRYQSEDDFGHSEGLSFVRVDESLRGQPELGDYAKHFFSDALPSLRGVPAEDGETLVWLDMHGQCDPELARALLIYPGSDVTNYYERTEVALTAATNTAVVIMLQDDELDETTYIRSGVTLCSAPTGRYVLTRKPSDELQYDVTAANNLLQVERTGSLTLTNVVLSGDSSVDDAEIVAYFLEYGYLPPNYEFNFGPLVYVNGGSLTMEGGASVTQVLCAWWRESAVEVAEEGWFTMRSGAEIIDCWNLNFMKHAGEEPVDGLASSGLCMDNGTADLQGGAIRRCGEMDESGVGEPCGMFVSAQSSVLVSGDVNIDSMLVQENAARASVILSDDFTGHILFVESDPWEEAEDKSVFGAVDADYAASASPDQLAGSATNFVNSADNGKGSAVTNETVALLVWENALETDEQGNRYYEDEYGNRYGEVVATAPVPPPEPPQWEVVTNKPTEIAFKSITRVSDTEWALVITDRVEYCNYRLLWTTNLVEGFISTGAWEHAVGPAADPIWTTNVITTGGAWFWRAEGADGTNMVLKTEE